VTALEGVAGAGKTTSLAAIREAAERDGYKVEGFAPTSRAAQKLSEAGIESSTLQQHLTRSEEPQDGQKRLHVLDESSLASTKQMNQFLHRLHEQDRVVLVGTRGSMKPSKPESHISSYKKPESRLRGSTKSCGRKTRR